jgi:hypothetical protein
MDPSSVRPTMKRSWAVLAAVAWSLLVVPLASAGTPARIGFARLEPACSAPHAGSVSCFAVVRRPVPANAAASAGVHAYVVGAGATGAGPAGGLTPAQVERAYGYDASGGSGQTVAIVDAYDDPKIEEDLEAFDNHYGLGECTKANGCFRKVNQGGSENPAALPAQDEMGWSEEISLDVEMVRAACRGCKILLVEANSAVGSDLGTAVNEAVALGATEVSNSYGAPEEGMTPKEQADYNHPGVVITAAAGDYGYDGWNYLLRGHKPPGMPDAPASLPSVVSVGGTSLQLHEDGTRASETVWNDDGFYDENELGAGYVAGSGCSTLFTAQPWQQDASGFPAAGCGDKRLSVDVSADADPLTGFDVYDNFDYCDSSESACNEEQEEEIQEAIERYGGWETFGGTSLGTPLIASLYALAGGSNGVKYPALTLYQHLGEAASLYDVTAGGDGFCDGEPALFCGEPNSEFGYILDCEGTSACDARPGYDGPSGVGTPLGLAAFRPILPNAAITPPTSAKAGIPASFDADGSTAPYPGATIASYAWSWGDGTAGGSGISSSHTFAKPGVYTVSLSITDSNGLTSTATESVGVGEGPQEEAARRQAEQEAATKKRSEEEAAKAGVLGSKEGSPDARIASTSLQVSASGLLRIKISCPAGEHRCTGRVSLRTLTAVAASLTGKPKPKPAILTLATGTFTVAGGKLVTVVLHLSAKVRTLLARVRRLHVRVTVVARDPEGATHTQRTIATLRAPKVNHSKG